MNSENMHEVRYMDLKEVERTVSLKKSAIYERMGEYEFPQNVPVAGTRKAWLSDQIQEYVKGRRDWAPGSEAKVKPKGVQISLEHHKAILEQWTTIFKLPAAEPKSSPQTPSSRVIRTAR